LTATHNDRNVGGRHVKALVQYTCADEDPQLPFGKKLEGPGALRLSDIAGYGLNEMLAGHGISGIVVSSKYQDASVPVPQDKIADGGPLRGAESNYRAGAPPGRERPPASIAPARGGHEIRPRGQGRRLESISNKMLNPRIPNRLKVTPFGGDTKCHCLNGLHQPRETPEIQCHGCVIVLRAADEKFSQKAWSSIVLRILGCNGLMVEVLPNNNFPSSCQGLCDAMTTSWMSSAFARSSRNVDP
jgi:hypothetical protein